MMEVFEIRIHLKPPSKGTHANSEYILAVAMVADSEDLGTWIRTMKHRGYNPDHVAARPMLDYERKNVKKSWRLQYIRYQSWLNFLSDEWETTKDVEWIKTLIAICPDNLDNSTLIKSILNHINLDTDNPAPQGQLSMF